ncbi:hypothetical protein [Candidatus Phytoplasma sacchari]|uniref:Uncharacterized protein n=1 Tax=Candidatus Phytoplasma sacchari TaxID=2609813 RepID=A0ABY7M111_9MOLU|nr:hypothetical protein O7R10_02325 [Candidatus Phytoplasma sacchari]
MILKNNIKLLNFLKYLFLIIIFAFITKNDYIFAMKSSKSNIKDNKEKETEDIISDDEEKQQFGEFQELLKSVKNLRNMSNDINTRRNSLSPFQPPQSQFIPFLPQDFEFSLPKKNFDNQQNSSIHSLTVGSSNFKRKLPILEGESTKKVKFSDSCNEKFNQNKK